MDQQEKTISGMIAGMLLIKLFDMMISPNHIFPGRTAEFSWIELLIVAILGLLAVKLSGKTDIPDMWNETIRNKKGIIASFGLGSILGLCFVAFDFFFKIGDINVGWPLSILFYTWGGISQEIIMHYFPLVLLLWIFVTKIFRGKYYTIIYWIISLAISIISAIGMVGAFGNPNIPLDAKYTFVPAVIGFLVFVSELILFKMMKRYGFIASLCTRFGFYAVWHVIWPIVFY